MKKIEFSLKSFPLISIMEHSDDIWGIKDCESRFIYTNRAFREFLDIPPRFKIEGKRDEQLPSPVAEFASELKKQDQKTIKSGQRVTLIKTHFFGREKKLEPYLYEKFSLYNEKKGVQERFLAEKNGFHFSAPICRGAYIENCLQVM